MDDGLSAAWELPGAVSLDPPPLHPATVGLNVRNCTGGPGWGRTPLRQVRQTELAGSLNTDGGFTYNQGGTLVGVDLFAAAAKKTPASFARDRVCCGVRRLTPIECERLQGFPDDWTLVKHRGRLASDGPRYVAIGNSMCVNVMRWIGRRIELVRSILEDAES